MTTKEYLELYHKCPDKDNMYPGWENDLRAIKDFNKELIRKYPWLEPHNDWSGKKITDCAGEDGEEGYWPGDPSMHPEYDYEYTLLDDMPDGWRIAFGDEMVERIQKELERFGYADKYFVTQIKEKYGGLRWYDDGVPYKLSDDYKELYCNLYNIEGEMMKPKTLENEVLKEHFRSHYISPFDKEKRGDMTDEEVEEYNRQCVVIYHLHKIVDECHVPDIISEYENKSYHTCITCGKLAKWESKGWISPYCDDCKNNMINREVNRLTEDSFSKLDDIYNLEWTTWEKMNDEE